MGLVMATRTARKAGPVTIVRAASTTAGKSAADMTPVDFTDYITAERGLEQADLLFMAGQSTRAQWLLNTAADVVSNLPGGGGTVGKPRNGSAHRVMVDQLSELFNWAPTDKARAQRVTRCIILCRIASAKRNLPKVAWSKMSITEQHDYMAKVDRWASVAGRGSKDDVLALINGKPRKASPPDGGKGDDSKGDTDSKGDDSKGDSGKGDTDPSKLLPLPMQAMRALIAQRETGAYDDGAWAKVITDIAYTLELMKSAKAPVKASA